MVLGGNQRGVRDGRVEGKVPLVAGAAGGIGGAGAAGLGRENSAVACADIDAALAEATAAPIGASGGRATAIGLGMREFGRLAARALLVLIEKTLPCGGGRKGRLTGARARRVDIVTPTDAVFRGKIAVRRVGTCVRFSASGRYGRRGPYALWAPASPLAISGSDR